MDRAEIGSFNRSSLKSGARTFLENSARPRCCESPLKLQCHLVRLFAIWKLIANGAHRSVSGFLSTTYSCWRQIWNLFPMAQGTFFSVADGAMNAPLLWELRKECLIDIGKCAKSVIPTFWTVQRVSYQHLKLRKECLSDIENCAKSILLSLARARWCLWRCWNQYTGSSSKRMEKLSSAFQKADTGAAYPYSVMHFIPALGI
jgi:hypothetical protein